MSTTPETEFDLEKLFLPAWAQETPAANRYSNFQGDTAPERGFGDRPGGRRPPRRDGGGGPRRDFPRRDGPRRDGAPQGGGQAGAPGQGFGPGPGRDQGRPPRRDGPRREGGGGPRRDFRRDQRPEHREPPVPLPELNVTLMPDDKGVESLARQIKVSGRSFPLFDIAQMILKKPERQLAKFEVLNKPDGAPLQPLFLCAIDDTLWLSEAEAVNHVLSKHFGMFYQEEKKPIDPPKGTYTFVAQCGMSGTILGPPNYHDYQNQLRKLHQERFSRMPFEAFKARVKIVKEEAVIKKWIEEQSFKTEYVALNVPEPLRFGSREEVEKNFREIHLPNIIKQVTKHTIGGTATRSLGSQGLQRLLRAAIDDQRRFPLQLATVLSQQFASHGLQFFKVNKTITHVSVARPHYLDLDATPVSDQVRKIVHFINATPKCNRKQLIETLAPTPPAPPATPAAAPAAEQIAPAEGITAPEQAAPQAQAPSGPTPEQAALIGDLHWLIHQGHVIEFANGILEMAKKPIVKPPKPPKPAPEAAATAEAGAAQTAPAMESAAPAMPAQQPEGSAEIASTVEPAAVAPAVETQPEQPSPAV